MPTWLHNWIFKKTLTFLDTVKLQSSMMILYGNKNIFCFWSLMCKRMLWAKMFVDIADDQVDLSWTANGKIIISHRLLCKWTRSNFGAVMSWGARKVSLFFAYSTTFLFFRFSFFFRLFYLDVTNKFCGVAAFFIILWSYCFLSVTSRDSLFHTRLLFFLFLRVHPWRKRISVWLEKPATRYYTRCVVSY